VGVGTVYRHFPTKEALFEAIVVSALDRLIEERRSLTAADDPGAAFFHFLSRMLDEGSASKTLKDALAGAGVDVKAATSGAANDLQCVTEALLAHAQRASAVRDDLDGDDLMAPAGWDLPCDGPPCRRSRCIRSPRCRPARRPSLPAWLR
jgi:AcrR family transcriptional regulator